MCGSRLLKWSNPVTTELYTNKRSQKWKYIQTAVDILWLDQRNRRGMSWIWLRPTWQVHHQPLCSVPAVSASSWNSRVMIWFLYRWCWHWSWLTCCNPHMTSQRCSAETPVVLCVYLSCQGAASGLPYYTWQIQKTMYSNFCACMTQERAFHYRILSFVAIK